MEKHSSSDSYVFKLFKLESYFFSSVERDYDGKCDWKKLPEDIYHTRPDPMPRKDLGFCERRSP
jgi:hypothetical protein